MISNNLCIDCIEVASFPVTIMHASITCTYLLFQPLTYRAVPTKICGRRCRRFFGTGSAPQPTKIDRRAAVDTMTSAHGSTYVPVNFFTDLRQPYNALLAETRVTKSELRISNSPTNSSVFQCNMLGIR